MSENKNSTGQGSDNTPSHFTGEAEIIFPENPHVPKPIPSTKNPPDIINVNPYTGEVTDFLSPTEVSLLNDVNSAQAEQDNLAAEHAESERRRFQEALQQRKLENAIFDHGEKRGSELSLLVNTREGRKKIEDMLTLAVKVNKRVIDSKEKIQDKILQIIDEEGSVGSIEIQKVIQDWEKRNGKLPYPEFVRRRESYREQVSELLRNIKDARQYLLEGNVTIDYTNIDNKSMYHTLKNPALQNLYDQGFQNAWNSTKDQAQITAEPQPWYLQESGKK